jgi:hypothetical protein
MERAELRGRTKFLVESIKPSHYDDDGYVIHWWRGFIPSNSLSSIYALTVLRKNYQRDLKRWNFVPI